MITNGWGTDRSILDLLFTEGFRFDFFRAVQILEDLYPKAPSVGAGPEPDKEAVRFKSRVDLGFPPTDIHDIVPGPEGEPAGMTVNFMGLAGAAGPLPLPYTRLIIERGLAHDTAFKAFLDIFNHRLISLFYRARKTSRIGLENRPADETRFARYLFSLIGLGLPGLRNRLGISDRGLLHYTGLLAQKPRSMKGLEIMLSDYFGVRVEGRQFIGQWLEIEPDQWTRIGPSGQNRELGQSAVLGTRVWSQRNKFELRVGPLDLSRFLKLLPIGRAYGPFCRLTRFYADPDLDFDLVLLLEAGEVPGLAIGGPRASRLGWTSWIHTRAAAAGNFAIRLSSSSEVPSALD